MLHARQLTKPNGKFASYLISQPILDAFALINLRKQNNKLHSSTLPVGEERTKLVQENSELLDWLSNQFIISEEKFAKYLNLKV